MRGKGNGCVACHGKLNSGRQVHVERKAPKCMGAISPPCPISERAILEPLFLFGLHASGHWSIFHV